ncbi:hypothetical protein AAFF_G00208180 [Aldrovandia affinis]|uniref:Tetraspanin n=1 Tax=Aldrovandia affinis TaxID=143900 RepID=A0AAD7W4N1_9TELE|nr:hypothetical protein AAFF_G00208180 [Aldrovandia affinis]
MKETQTRLNLKERTPKHLIIFNTLFAILGIAVLGLGLWLRFSSQTGGFFSIDLNTKQFVIGLTVLIVTGALVLITSAFGNYGACNENKTALRVFSCALGVLAAVEILAGVLAFMYSDEVGEELSAFYSTVYAQYINKAGDPSLSVTLKIFHNALKCCGIGGVLEPFVRDTCPSSKSFIDAITMPACPKVVRAFFKAKAPLALGLFIGTGVLMIFALVCCRVLIKHIRTYQAAPKY